MNKLAVKCFQKGRWVDAVILQFVYDHSRGDVVAIGLLNNGETMPRKFDLNTLALPKDVLFEGSGGVK